MFSYNSDCIYIAGPMCFYPNGYELWNSMGKLAEHYGFRVSMPTKNILKLDNKDLRKNADTIFANCVVAMNQATIIIVDLEQFRGSEPDGGSLFELGMAYARGIRCYGFTRDKRSMLFKHAPLHFEGQSVYDEDRRPLPYSDLPFSPSVIGSCKIIEGSFEDCLKLVILDLEEERKLGSFKQPNPKRTTTENPVKKVYLSGTQRFDTDGAEKYQKMKSFCEEIGLQGVSPLDIHSNTQSTNNLDPYSKAYQTFKNCSRLIQDCDFLLADLNDFHGYEPNSDIAFECGLAWQLGKKSVGYMSDTRSMRERLPHLGSENNYLDHYGFIVEDFDYPINLMFASSMDIIEGGFKDALEHL